MNPVIGSLIENLEGIKIVYAPTVDPFRKDTLNTGDAKEFTIKEFLERYLTSDYKVKRGKIYGMSGETNSIDCVILAPNHPPLITPKREVLIAEGVYAAIEVKPDIGALTEGSEFHRALLQVKSIKDLQRLTFIPELPALLGQGSIRPDYFKKIPAGIFSFKSTAPTRIIDYIRLQVTNGILTSEEIPDLIVTMDNGVIFYCPHVKFSWFNKTMDDNYESYPDQIFIHCKSEEHFTLLWFLLILLYFSGPVLKSSISILYQYLVAAIAEQQVDAYPLYVTDTMKAK